MYKNNLIKLCNRKKIFHMIMRLIGLIIYIKLFYHYLLVHYYIIYLAAISFVGNLIVVEQLLITPTRPPQFSDNLFKRFLIFAGSMPTGKLETITSTGVFPHC